MVVTLCLQGNVPVLDLLRTATNMGIQVLSCDKMEKEMSKLGILKTNKKRSEMKSSKRSRNKTATIILGDLEENFRPVLKEFRDSFLPSFDIHAHKGSCPFDPIKRPRKSKAKPRRIGYCECCRTTYENGIEHHLKTKAHLNFAKDDRNYSLLDSFCLSMNLLPDETETATFHYGNAGLQKTLYFIAYCRTLQETRYRKQTSR